MTIVYRQLTHLTGYRIVRVILLGLMLVSLNAPVAARQANRPHATTFPVDTFVGPDFVDFSWDPADIPGCETFSVSRKTSTTSYTLIATPSCTAGFYTDSTASAGVAYQYYLSVQNDAEPPVTLYYRWVNGTPGQIGGKLHRSLSLSGALTITGIGVGDGGQLSLSNATLSGGSIVDAILEGNGTLREQGLVTVNGGVFDGTTLQLKNPNSSVAGLSMTDGALNTVGSVQDVTFASSSLGFYGNANVSLSGSTFEESNVSFAESVGADIGQNAFVSSTLHIQGTATADVYSNNFHSSTLRVREQAEVLADTNDFAGTIPNTLAFITIETDAGVTLRSNTLTVNGNAGTEPAILIWPNTAPAEGAIYALTSNVLGGDNGDTIGVKVWADEPGSVLDLTLTDNTIGRFARAVYMEDFNSNKAINVTLSGNTLTSNAYGLYPSFGGSESGLVARNNCIANNTYGVRCVNRDFVIDAINNYWGHPLGPTHLSNPKGLGDRLLCSDAAAEINYTPWLESHGCYISELSIADVQTMQAISSTTLLVAEKPAVVRVFPDLGLGFSAVDGTLTGSRAGAPLGTLQARSPIRAGSISDWDAVLGDLDASLVFDLPQDWLHGTLTLRAEVGTGTTATACASSTAEETAVLTSTATFHERRPVSFTYIPATLTTYTEEHPVTPEDILAIHDQIMARLPFGEASVRILPDMDRADPNLTGLAAGMAWTEISAVVRRWDIINNHDDVTDFYITVYGTDSAEYTGSWWFGGEPNGRGACGSRFDGYDCVVTMGNLLGMRPMIVDPKAAIPPFDYVFPYADGLTHVLGYDTVSGELQPPTYYDLMTTEAIDGQPNWISDFHYEKAYFNLAPTAPAAHALDATDPLATGNYLYVTGYAGPDNGAFKTVLHLPDSPAPDDVNPVDPAGAYCLQARDIYGHVLEETCFDLNLINIDTGVEDDWTLFTAALTDDPAIKQLLLRTNGSPLKQLVVPSSPPQLTLVSASYEADYEALQIDWTTPLEDAPDLRYHVHYSADNGATWMPVGVNITPDEVNYFDNAFHWGVRAAQIPAGAQAKVRLIATDGYNETTVTSAAFTMPDVGPWLDILSPAYNAVVETFPLTFQGYAYDIENGDRRAAMTWTSDKDGLLGTGSPLSVTTLSPGTHIVTLSADDGDGHVATDTVRLTVEGSIELNQKLFLPLVLR